MDKSINIILEAVVRYAVKSGMEYDRTKPGQKGFYYLKEYAGLGHGGSTPEHNGNYWWCYWINLDGSVKLTGQQIGWNEYQVGRRPKYDKVIIPSKKVRIIANNICAEMQGQARLFKTQMPEVEHG